MTSPHPPSGPDAASAAGCPRGRHTAAAPLPIYGEEFSSNPQDTYVRLREQGPIVPVEIAPGVVGMLTTTYPAALHLLRNTPERFYKNPRNWQALEAGDVPPDSPALVMMQPRDNALWMDGAPHERLRGAITDSLQRVDTHALATMVARLADGLLDVVAPRGEADLVAEFADALPMMVLIEMFGSPPDIGVEIVQAIAKMFDTDQDAAKANAELEEACLALAHLKRSKPGPDVTSWMLAHPAALTDEEMVQTILLNVGAGTAPSTNLISNTLRMLITNDRFAGTLSAGVQRVSDALDYVLWEDPPMANYCPLYARPGETFEGALIQPGVPILVSFAAANSDPALRTNTAGRAGNRAHLAFSAGRHGCPASDLARVIAETAIERVLDRLPDLTLAVPADQLTRRPGTFHSGLVSLPVTFPPTAPSAS